MFSIKQKPLPNSSIQSSKKIFSVFPIYKYKISGMSMSPTFADGEEILVNRLSYVFKNPKVGEIIALKDPRDKKILIKRIAKIVEDTYFVQGDNKQHSTDSRKFGMIEKSDIIGKVLLRYSP